MGKTAKRWRNTVVAFAILAVAFSSILQSLRLEESSTVRRGDVLSALPVLNRNVSSSGVKRAENDAPSSMKASVAIHQVRRTSKWSGKHSTIRINETTSLQTSTTRITSGNFTSRIFNNFTNNLARGANIMTSVSGCHIAAWVYFMSPDVQTPDCSGRRSYKPQLWIHRGKKGPLPEDLQPYDTVFVHKRILPSFVKRTFPFLKSPIVLLTGSYENSRKFRIPEETARILLNSPMIAHWFCTNVDETISVKSLPPKLRSMALGIEPFGKSPKKDANPVVILRDVLLRHAKELPNKTIGVFEAYTSPFTNPNRKTMPRGTKMLLPDYLEHLAKSKFVISPNGHKPDCFRHYEALAFGAIPITELDPTYYSHLQAGPVVFNNSEWWNLTESKMLRQLNLSVFPTVNRNLIFEEYWMEDMERLVGRPLRWFDIRRNQQSFIKDFYLNFEEIPQIINSAWADYSNDSAAILARFVGGRGAWQQKQWPPGAFDDAGNSTEEE